MEQCKDLLDKHCTTEYFITRETVQNRQCGKVDEQICSKAPQGQCMDFSTGKCSTSYEKVGDRQPAATVSTPWPAERPISSLCGKNDLCSRFKSGNPFTKARN